MTIAPLTTSPQEAYSSFDFTPLAQLGNQLQQRRQQSELAALGERYQTPASAPSPAWPTGQTTAVPGYGGSTDQYGRAISAIESGSRGGNYAELGPVIQKTGDRAYGRYQVMGQNIPEWSRAALGRTLTPQEFLRDTAAQDAVFKHRFNSYVQKYGPSGAARAWFAGEGGMNNPNARDPLGTSVADYERKFNSGLY
jgi:hypothetical protein